MSKPFVSIIVPVYNVEAYLRECIDSIVGQSSDDWELILVDDGSPDGCPQICDEYAERDERIKVIHKPNGGVSTARNAGLDAAQGEWVWFVDSDDWIATDAVEKLKELLTGGVEYDLVVFAFTIWKDGVQQVVAQVASCGFADVDAFLSGNICFYNQRMLFRREMIENVNPQIVDQVMFGHVRHENGDDIEHFGVNDTATSKDELLSCHKSFFNPCMLFKNSVIDSHKLRFTEGIRLAEDLEFQYKYEMMCRRPIAIADALYHYRIREGSVTHVASYRTHAVEDIAKVLCNLLQFIRHHGVKPERWINIRLRLMMQNLLYSASHAEKLDVGTFQREVRNIVDDYRAEGFVCFDDVRMRLAYRCVRLYFIANKIYLKLKGLS